MCHPSIRIAIFLLSFILNPAIGICPGEKFALNYPKDGGWARKSCARHAVHFFLHPISHLQALPLIFYS